MRAAVLPGFRLRLSRIQVLAFALLCSANSSLHASEVWLNDLDAGIARARQLSKPIFVDVMAPWCGYCRKMRDEVFSTTEFKNTAASYVLVRLNADENPDVRRFDVSGLPTMILLDKNGYTLSRLDGFTPLPSLLRVMREALTKSSMEDKIVRDAKERPGVESAYRAGLYYAKINDQPKARTYFLAAWNAGKTSANATAKDSLYNAAVSSMEMKDYAAAVQLWSDFVKAHNRRDSDLAYARYFRGLSLRSMGRLQDAKDDIAYAAANLPEGEDKQAAARMNSVRNQ
jgi:thioredoxin-like negative regulator of GroEL